MNRYFIELSYNGSVFNGWQIQPNAPSVQENIAKNLSTLLKQKIKIFGAGRTDTGVHAKHFYAHFEIDILIDTNQITYKLNKMLPRQIAIQNIFEVAPNMHARFSALSRTYKYYITKYKDPFNYMYLCQILPFPDIERMNKACKYLSEYTDFTSFSKSRTGARTNNCNILFAEWKKEDSQLVFTIKANRFLRNMVRAIVGTLISIGQGKIEPEDIKKIIEKRDRGSAGVSVAGYALFLTNIEYPEGFDQYYENKGKQPKQEI